MDKLKEMLLVILAHEVGKEETMEWVEDIIENDMENINSTGSLKSDTRKEVLKKAKETIDVWVDFKEEIAGYFKNDQR